MVYFDNMHHTLDQDSIHDLLEDTKIFEYLLADYRHKISSVSHTTNTFIQQSLASLEQEIYTFKKALLSNKKIDQSIYFQQKQNIINFLHTISGFIGQFIVMNDWQSPPIGSKIIAHYNDYSRDQHLLGAKFEKQYRKEYINIPKNIPVYAYATSSGMAAITTAALFILGETPSDRNIIMGKSCYFETKQLLHGIFGSRIYEVETSDITLLKEAILKFNPVALFLDSIGNEPNMRLTDVATSIQTISKNSKQHTYIIIDTSVSSLSTPYVRGYILPGNVSLIGVESQNKLLQFGLDRVTAGIVWGTGHIACKLYDYRDHAGTNCPDATIATLPKPNKKMASMYIKRIQRNAKLLTDIFHHRKVPIIHTPTSPYCILTWKNTLFHSYKRYVHNVMRATKHANIAIVYGTSFGFNITRIYPVAMHTHYEVPFLRISPGTETQSQIQELGKILIECL